MDDAPPATSSGGAAAAVAAGCRRHLASVEASLEDGRQTLAAVSWGISLLLALESPSAASNEADNKGSVLRLSDYPTESGHKRKALEELNNPKQKSLKVPSIVPKTETDEMTEDIAEDEGEKMAKRVTTKLNSAECTLLVNLINHCLLISVDQVCPDAVAKPANLDSENDTWLFKWVVKEVLKEEKENGMLCIASLSWLLAFLLAARPEYFLKVILDQLVSELLEAESSGRSLLLSYLRYVSIFEYAALRVPDSVSTVLLALVPPERFSSYLLEWNTAKNMATADSVQIECHSYAWLVLMALCPKLLVCLAKVWLPRLESDHHQAYWNLLQSASKHGRIPVPEEWATCLETKTSNAEAWVSVIITKRTTQLASVAADVVLLLSKTNLSLLNWFNQELCPATISHITGKHDAGQTAACLEVLIRDICRLWDTFLAGLSSFDCPCCEGVSKKEKSEDHERCVFKDPLLQTCQLTMLHCEESLVADLLAKATRIVVVMMRILGLVEKDHSVIKLWVLRMIHLLQDSDSEQAVSKVIGIRQLLDSRYWGRCTAAESTLLKDNAISWKSTRSRLWTALQSQYLQLMVLLQRDDGAWDLRLNVLGLLEAISAESGLFLDTHLKAALGIYFQWLRKSNYCEDLDAPTAESSNVWQQIRSLTIVKRIIVQIASSSLSNFTLLADKLINFSFEPSEPTGHNNSLSGSKNLLNENCKTKSARSSQQNQADTLSAEIGSLLRQCHSKSVANMKENPKQWTVHPAEVLSKLLVDRLQTPHEIPMTMEQYEEIVPRQVSSLRHSFIINCFLRRSPFLFSVLQLVMANKEIKTEAFGCSEFVRSLLAETICLWHNSMLIHHKPLQLHKATTVEPDRLKVFEMIEVIESADWLPQPLASCKEIITLIDGADMESLLILLWRCMHHAIAFGPNRWRIDEQGNKEGYYTEWEGQLLAILRRNVSRIGAHFAQVYPLQ